MSRRYVDTSLPSPSGRPSTPQVALTPTTGGLTVQLTVMYPGTREDTLQYSISAGRQTGQQPLPVNDLTTPTSGSAEVALGPGTYSVTVTVTNQHSSYTSVPQQITILGWLLFAPAACTHPLLTSILQGHFVYLHLLTLVYLLNRTCLVNVTCMCYTVI